MKRAAVFAAALPLVLSASAANAFNVGPAWLNIGTVETFFVSNTLATDLTWAAGNSMTLVQLIRSADQAAQYWNVSARINIALAVDQAAISMGSVPPGGGLLNSRNDIYARPGALDPAEAGTAAYTWCMIGADRECDIVLFTSSWPAPPTTFPPPPPPTSPTPVVWSGVAGMNAAGKAFALSPDQILAHEMGHALGLYHPDNALCDNVPAGNTGVPAPLMCPSVAQSHHDHPSQDDIDGVRAPITGYTVINRNVGIMKGTVGPSGAITWNEDFSSVVIQSHVRPRISCRRGIELPDCVVVTTDGANSVRLTGIVWDDPWVMGAQTVMANASRHEIDVALGEFHDGFGTRAVITRMADAGGDFRAWFGSWDPVNGGAVFQGTFVGGGGVLNVREPPRVSYHATVGNNDGSQGAFVAVLLDSSRTFRVAVSTNHLGTAFATANPANFADGVVRRGFGHFDVSCPTHQTSSATCRVVFNARTTPGTAGNTVAADLSGVQTACSFTVSNNAHTVSNWTCNLTSNVQPMAVSLSDYGDTPPVGGLASPAWLLSAARRSPFNNLNTTTIFNSGNSPSLFVSPDRDVDVFDTPFQPSAPLPFSLWGGVSCDWVDFKKTFACVQLKESTRW